MPIIVKNSLIPLSFLASTFLGIRIFADSRNKIKRDNGEKYYRDVISFENSTNNANIQNVISKLEYEGENGEAYRGEYRGCCKSFFDYARKAMTTGNEKNISNEEFQSLFEKSFAPFITSNSTLSPEKKMQKYIDDAVQG